MRALILYLSSNDSGPVPWIVFDPISGAVVESGEAGDGRVLNPSGPIAQCLVVVPGTAVTAHRIDLPILSNARARIAVVSMLEDDLAADTNDLHVALAAAGAPRLVAVTARNAMDTWLARAAALGMKPTLMIPDYLAIASSGEETKTYLHDGLILARTPSGGFAAEPDLAAWLLDDAAQASGATALSTRGVLEEAGHTLRAGVPVNMLQSAYTPRRDWSGVNKTWRRSAVLAASLAVALVAGQVAEGFRLTRQAEAAYARTEALARAALPDVKRIVNPKAQVRAALQQARASGSAAFLKMAEVVVGAVNAVDGTAVDSFRFDGKRGELVFALSLPSFAAADRVKSEIARQGGILQEGGARQEGARIVAEMTLRQQ